MLVPLRVGEGVGSPCLEPGQQSPQRWPLQHIVEGLALSPRPSASGLVSWGFSQVALQRLPRPQERAPGDSQEQGTKE